MTRRTEKLNSLLKEVISEVIFKDVRNPNLSPLLTITRVEISNDLHYAKVYVSIIGDEKNRAETIEALQSAAGFIAVNASKKVTMRYFPSLTFKLDDSVDALMRIDQILGDLEKERQSRDERSE